MRDLILTGTVLICAVIAIWRPVFGMIAYMCVSLLNPNSWTWGLGQHFPSAQLLILGTMVGFVFSPEPKTIPLRRETVLLLILWGVFGITTIFADYPDVAFDRLVHVSKIFLATVLSMAIIRTEAGLRWLLRVIALSLGIHGLNAGVFFVTTGGQYMVWGPENSFLYANNMIGLALAMNVPMLLFLASTEENRWLSRLMRLMALFSYPAVIGTYSRGAWLGLAAVTVLMVLRSRHRILLGSVVAIAAIISLPFLPERATSRYGDLVNYEEESSAQSRIWNWRFARHVTMANPVLGAGFEYYGLEAYERYYPEFQEVWPGKVWSCHSIWFTMMSEHGLVGFAVWMALLFGSLLSLETMRRASRWRPDMAWVGTYAVMLQIAFVAFMVSGTFLDAVYFDLFFQLIAVVVIMKEAIGYPALKQQSGDAPSVAQSRKSIGRAPA